MLMTSPSGQSTTMRQQATARRQLSPPELHLNGAPGDALLASHQEPQPANNNNNNNNKLSVVLPANQKSLHTPNIITSDVASPSQLFGSLIHQLNSHGESVGLFTGLASCTPTSADALAPSPSLASINPFFWNVAASHSSNDSKHSTTTTSSSSAGSPSDSGAPIPLATASQQQQQQVMQPEAPDKQHQKRESGEQLSLDQQLQAASAIMLSPLAAFSPLSPEQEAWLRLRMPHHTAARQLDTAPPNQVAAHQQPPPTANSRPAHQQAAASQPLARLHHAHTYLREPQSGPPFPVVAQLKPAQSVADSCSSSQASDKTPPLPTGYTSDQQQQQISAASLQYMAQQANADPAKTHFFPTSYPILYQHQHQHQQQQQHAPPTLPVKRPPESSLPPAAHLASSQAPPDFNGTPTTAPTLPGTSPIHYELFHYDPKLQHLYLAQQQQQQQHHHNDTTPIYSNLQHQQQQQRGQCYQELPIKQQQQQPCLYQQHQQPPINASAPASHLDPPSTQTAPIIHTSSPTDNTTDNSKQASQQPLNSSNNSQQKMNPVCEQLTNKENLLAHSSFSSANASFNNHPKPPLNNSNVGSLVSSSAATLSCSSSTRDATTSGAHLNLLTGSPSPSKSNHLIIHPPNAITKCSPKSKSSQLVAQEINNQTQQASKKSTPHPKRAPTSGGETPQQADTQQDPPALPKKKSKVGRKKKQVSHDELVARKNRSKERNRVAAKRCRQKRKQFLDDLRGRIDNLNESNKRMLKENLSLRSELELLKRHHKTCRIN